MYGCLGALTGSPMVTYDLYTSPGHIWGRLRWKNVSGDEKNKEIFLFTTKFISSWTIVLQGLDVVCMCMYVYVYVCMCMSPSFMDFHDGITFECIEIEGWNLLHSTPNIILFHCRTLHDCRIIILAKIANLTLFYYVIFMDFHDGISFDGIKLDGWNLLQSAFNLILLHKWTRHDCQIISLACIM